MGCHACEVACKQEHGLGVGPRVIRVIERAPYFKPLFCHHCEDAPCALACPESAITKDPRPGSFLLTARSVTAATRWWEKSGAEKQGDFRVQGGMSRPYRCPGICEPLLLREDLKKPYSSSNLQVLSLPFVVGSAPTPVSLSVTAIKSDKPVAIHAT